MSASAITIRVPQPVKDAAAGVTELRLQAGATDGLTVRALLSGMAASHPDLHRNVCDETGSVRRHLNLFVNSDHIRDLGGLDTVLSPGDVVTILPAVSGG